MAELLPSSSESDGLLDEEEENDDQEEKPRVKEKNLSHTMSDEGTQGDDFLKDLFESKPSPPAPVPPPPNITATSPPATNTLVQLHQEEEERREKKKPVVSAREMLLKFLHQQPPPPTTSTTSISKKIPMHRVSPTSAVGRLLRQTKALPGASGTVNATKRTCASSSTTSKKAVQRNVFHTPDRLTESTTNTGARTPNRDTTDTFTHRKKMKTSLQDPIQIQQQPIQQQQSKAILEPTEQKKKSFWETQISPPSTTTTTTTTTTRTSTIGSSDTTNTRTYVSPFRGGSFVTPSKDSLKRPNERRESKTGHEIRREIQANKAKLAARQSISPTVSSNSPSENQNEKKKRKEEEEDDDFWFADAKEIQEEDTEPPQTSNNTSRSFSTSVSSVNSSTKKKRRLSRELSSLSSGDDEAEDEIYADKWPRLPPPDNIQGPLILDKEKGIQVCANINSYLFDYQSEGIQFLYQAYARNSGAILGDEMGLGKTIQVIALVAALLGKQGTIADKHTWRTRQRQASSSPNELVLIIVPASLLQNWELELHTWMFCQVLLLHGKNYPQRQILLQEAPSNYEIVLCSYEILKIHLEEIKKIKWKLILLDEMHCLKNPEAKTTKAVQALTKCPYKIGLTGTLMQNNEEELHCLVSTIVPGLLGNLQDFRQYYASDIKYGRKKGAPKEVIARSRQKEKQLQAKLAIIYLRRDKKIHPMFNKVFKKDQVVFCDLTPLQQKCYERILLLPEYVLLRRGDEICDCGHLRTSGRLRKQCCYTIPSDLGDIKKAVMWERLHSNGQACSKCPTCLGLVCVAQLLKLANHLDLLKINPKDSIETQEATKDFAIQAFGDDIKQIGGLYQAQKFQEMKDTTKVCGKMKVLNQLLTVWKKKRQKCLIFSRSTRMLDLLQHFLIGKGIEYVRLDGNTKIEERLQIVQKFNQTCSIQVFLISTKAGGLGLNITSARNVVVFDPSWNPAHDMQAQDRAYRIGQTKNVQVFRLITLGTIEEMIYVRQIYKQQLSDTTLKRAQQDLPRYFEGIQGDPSQKGELFGLKNLLDFKEGGVLKGIQDAYLKDQETGILMKENQVVEEEEEQGNKTFTSSSSSAKKKGKKKQDGEKNEVEEMVEVADEMIQLMELSPAKQLQQQQEEEEEEFEWEGATRLIHEEIIREDVKLPSTNIITPDGDHGTLLRTIKPKENAELYQKIPEESSNGPQQQQLVEEEEEEEEEKEEAQQEEIQPKRPKLYVPTYL